MADQPARRRRVDPAHCPGHSWISYTRPVIRPAEGIAYNARCRYCHEKVWRG